MAFFLAKLHQYAISTEFQTYLMWQGQAQLDLEKVSNDRKICSGLPTLSDTASAYPLR
jgi:hypothetical protein